MKSTKEIVLSAVKEYFTPLTWVVRKINVKLSRLSVRRQKKATKRKKLYYSLIVFQKKRGEFIFPRFLKVFVFAGCSPAGYRLKEQYIR